MIIYTYIVLFLVLKPLIYFILFKIRDIYHNLRLTTNIDYKIFKILLFISLRLVIITTYIIK